MRRKNYVTSETRMNTATVRNSKTVRLYASMGVRGKGGQVARRILPLVLQHHRGKLTEAPNSVSLVAIRI